MSESLFAPNNKVGKRIFECLCEHPYGLTSKELKDKVWGHDPNGGPEYNALAVHIIRLNAIFVRRKLGMRIRGWCHRGTYQIWFFR